MRERERWRFEGNYVDRLIKGKKRRKRIAIDFKFLDPWLRTKFRARTSLTTFLEWCNTEWCSSLCATSTMICIMLGDSYGVTNYSGLRAGRCFDAKQEFDHLSSNNNPLCLMQYDKMRWLLIFRARYCQSENNDESRCTWDDTCESIDHFRTYESKKLCHFSNDEFS